MSGSKFSLTGIDEGLSVQISTTAKGAESPLKIFEAVSQIFPTIERISSVEPVFGQCQEQLMSWDGVSLEVFLQKIREQKILDTALDVMTLNLSNNKTDFSIVRQAALTGKIAFPIPRDVPLGGVIHVKLEADHLLDWIQSATWHEGREQFPRFIDDERGMDNKGDSQVWYDLR